VAKTARTYDITNENVSPIRTIIWLAWPVLVEQILATMVSYADTAMVGALGAYATASVAISNSPIMFINGIAMSLGVGLTALVARSVGAGEIDHARKLIRHSVLMMLYIGLPLGILVLVLSRQIPLWMGADTDIIEYATQYNIIVGLGRPFAIASMIFSSVIRGYGDTKTPMRINLGVNILNVLGNFLLIHPTRTVTLLGMSFVVPGAGWGVNGAAAATAISMTACGILTILVLFRKKNPMRIALREDYRIDWKLTRQVINISIPAMLERMCMSSAGILVTQSIASLGTAVVAANSLYLTAESMSFMPGFAFATAITTMVGQCLGAKKPDLAVKLTYTTCWFSAATLTFMGGMLFIFARPILRFFTPDEEVIQIAIGCLRTVAFLQPFQVVAWVLAGALRGAGDTRWAFYITALTTWGIRALGAVLLIRVFGFGLQEAVYCMFADGVVRMILLYLRFRTGKWKTAVKEV